MWHLLRVPCTKLQKKKHVKVCKVVDPCKSSAKPLRSVDNRQDEIQHAAN